MSDTCVRECALPCGGRWPESLILYAIGLPSRPDFPLAVLASVSVALPALRPRAQALSCTRSSPPRASGDGPARRQRRRLRCPRATRERAVEAPGRLLRSGRAAFMSKLAEASAAAKEFSSFRRCSSLGVLSRAAPRRGRSGGTHIIPNGRRRAEL